MPRIGIAVVEFATLLNQYLSHAIANHDGAQGLIARGDAFGQGHDVGAESEMWAAEPGPEAPEAADHLIRDQQNSIVVADALDLGPIARRRNDHAAGSLHRLAGGSGDVVRSPPFDLVGQAAGRRDA